MWVLNDLKYSIGRLQLPFHSCVQFCMLIELDGLGVW